jgi:tRNA pseudouridine55 synthase
MRSHSSDRSEAGSVGSGILLLDKPAGMTSNAALQRAKRVLDIRKAGHTGSLDPMATGLLPLCFGEATKVSAFLLDADKGYRAEVKLGVETDSGDAEGAEISSADVPALTESTVEEALDRFRGSIEQVPPMHSALKHRGRRLHELARAGIEVERPPRPVRIHRLTLTSLEPDGLRLAILCSKGTYVRSLAVDLGRALGCGAHLSALRRTRSGPFRLVDSIGLDELENLDRDDARARLLSPDRALPHWPRVDLDDAALADVRHGRPVAGDYEVADGVRMYADGGFIGLGAVGSDGVLRVKRLFKIGC